MTPASRRWSWQPPLQEPTLLTNATLIDKSREKTFTRAYSVARILQADVDLLAADLSAVAETIPELSEETP